MPNVFDELTATSTTRRFAPGTIRSAVGNSYVYVQLSALATGAASNGTVLYSTLSDANVVTDDISTTAQNLARGVAIGAIATGSYGWIQTWGGHSAVKTDGGDDIATGDAVIGDYSLDGVCDSVTSGTAPTNKVLGWASSADSDTANTVAVFLTLERGD